MASSELEAAARLVDRNAQWDGPAGAKWVRVPTSDIDALRAALGEPGGALPVETEQEERFRLADELSDEDWERYKDDHRALMAAEDEREAAAGGDEPPQDAAEETERLRAFARWVADNAMADDPVWVARDALRDYSWSDVPSAPEWFRERARAVVASPPTTKAQ